MSHLILVDGNNLGFSSMTNPKLVSGTRPTQGTFTFIRKIRNIYLENPNALILVLWDGASWRKDIYAEYKDKRQSTTQQQKTRTEYYDQKGDMQKALTYLGVAQCFSINMEADDLAEIYSRKWTGNKVTLVSGDMDWIQLVDERTTWYDPIRDRMVNLHNFKKFTGYKDSEQFVEAKSILGDKDEVPGINGIGPKTLDIVYTKFNMSFRHFLDSYLSNKDGFEEQWRKRTGKNLPLALAKAANPNTFIQLANNDKLGDLRTPHRPEPINLTRKQAPIDVDKFEELCYDLAFLSIAKQLDKFVGAFVNNRYSLRAK